MDIFAAATGYVEKKGGAEYPDVPEFPLKELLLLEKECSGMYFSGHMIDHYSEEIEQLAVDKISDILASVGDSAIEDSRYSDRCKVKIAGIINAKRTKVTKNGDTMAFITVEDRYAEIEVIAFARQYASFASEMFVENAVVIEGTMSVEDGDEVRILLSSVKTLGAPKQRSEATGRKTDAHPKLYIKLPNLSEPTLRPIYRLANFNRGDAVVVLFDESTRRYSAVKGISLDPSEKVLGKLREQFGNENVVLK